MRLAKKILLGLAGLIVLLLIIAAFVPRSYTVEREVLINKPKQQVFDYVKTLRNQTNWTTWSKMDPTMKMEFTGADGEVGSTYRWIGDKDNVGEGTQEIKSIRDGERVDIQLHFIKPFDSTAPVWLNTEAVSENQTRVKWGMTGTMPYPMNLMRVIMNIDKMIGDEYQKSLLTLKGILEAQ